MGVDRPERGASDKDDLVRLVTSTPVTLVWDDLPSVRKLAPLVSRFAAQRTSSRMVLVSRRYISAKEGGIRTPVFEVKPLGEDAAIELVRAVEAARGRPLAADIAEATAGNPLLIHLALAGNLLGARVSGDPTEALKQAIEARHDGMEGAVLALLSAAGVPLDEAEVARATGKGADSAIDELRKHLIVVREGTRVSVAAPAVSLVREVVGEPKPATWRSLGRLADRVLAASPNDDAAVLVAARARLELDDASDALGVLKQHPIARAGADPMRLERILRDIAMRSADDRLDALRLLAREQLRASDFEAARRTLDDLPRPRTREDTERAALLRAECHVRAGEPEAAQRALDDLLARRGNVLPSPALALTQVQLAILRGELAEARTLAERLGPGDIALAGPRGASRRRDRGELALRGEVRADAGVDQAVTGCTACRRRTARTRHHDPRRSRAPRSRPRRARRGGGEPRGSRSCHRADARGGAAGAPRRGAPCDRGRRCRARRAWPASRICSFARWSRAT